MYFIHVLWTENKEATGSYKKNGPATLIHGKTIILTSNNRFRIHNCDLLKVSDHPI